MRNLALFGGFKINLQDPCNVPERLLQFPLKAGSLAYSPLVYICFGYILHRWFGVYKPFPACNPSLPFTRRRHRISRYCRLFKPRLLLWHKNLRQLGKLHVERDALAYNALPFFVSSRCVCFEQITGRWPHTIITVCLRRQFKPV